MRLPPDLQLVVDNFRLELEDSDFECRLRDNYRLMVDESEENEKRRKVLDQRISDIRRSKGELLPALQVSSARSHYFNRSTIYFRWKIYIASWQRGASEFTWIVQRRCTRLH